MRRAGLWRDSLTERFASSSFDDREHQPRRMRRVMEDPIDRRSVLTGSLAGDVPARVAVAAKAWEVAARDFKPDAVARQKHVRCGPQVESELVDRLRFEELRQRK